MADGKLQLVGIIQEQHAERCRLFAQWKQFDFPILQDSFTEIGLGVVPVAVLLDENGFVQALNPRTRQIAKLVGAAPKNGAAPVANEKEATPDHWKSAVQAEPGNLDAIVRYGDALMKSGKQEAIPLAIEAYESARNLMKAKDQAGRKLKHKIGAVDFRMGVAHRRLFDIGNGVNTVEFQLASRFWDQALSANPNQYIWRRRIQQYGPGLAKPYPFYDWVDQAKQEIEKRGEQPITLKVPLTGSEIAGKQRGFKEAGADDVEPDPDAKINLDTELIVVESTAVPSTAKPKQAVRVYLHWKPKSGKWNNESTPMQVWLNVSGGKTNRKLVTLPNAGTAESAESRWVEFEVIHDGESDEILVEGYGLYNACDKADHACLYLRKGFRIPISVAK